MNNQTDSRVKVVRLYNGIMRYNRKIENKYDRLSYLVRMIGLCQKDWLSYDDKSILGEAISSEIVSLYAR